MKRTLAILFAGTFAFLLLAAPSIRFNIKIPAYIDLPADIRSLALIDRTAKDKNAANVVEGLITGEVIGKDRSLSQYTLNGLSEMLANSQRVSIVRTGKVYRTTGTGKTIPEPMSWEEAAEICRQNSTDALLALELYDSDYMPGLNEAAITVGFRIYDVTSRQIADQYIFTHRIAVGRPAPTIAGAVHSYMQDDNMMRDVSYEAGIIYGRRIAPTWYNVERTYYRKPKSDRNLAEGARMMEVNDWNGAIAALEQAAVNGKKRKTRGRASHNLAVVYEITGDLVKAREWAQTAWARHENKESKHYLYILNDRQNETERLKYQMGE
jgi:hypothetical protein